MTMIKRAIRNIIRKKGLSLIIIVIMSLSMAILLSIPASINATQQQIEQVKEENNQYTQRQRELLNESASLIEVSSSNSGIGSAVGMGTSVAISDSSGDPDIKISTLFESPLINYSVADDIKNAIEGIEGILPLYEKDVGEFEKRDDEFLGREIEFWVSYYQAVGVPLNSSYANKLLSLEFLEGKNLEVGNEKQVIISSDLQEELDTDVGRYLDVNGTNFEIVGVFKSSFGTEKLAYMALSEAQNAFNIGNKISKINVYAKEVSNVESISNEIKSRFQLMTTTSSDKASIYEMSEKMNEQNVQSMAEKLDQMQATAIPELIFAIITSSAMILFIMLYTVKLRTKEIGVLKAIGFSGKSIMAQFMTEGTIVGVIGGILGIIIGIVNATTFSQLLLSKSTSDEINIVSYGITNIGYGSNINSSLTPLISIELVLFVLLVSIGLSLLGSLYPAWQASRKSPMEAMRNE